MKEINRFYIMGNKLPLDDGSPVSFKDHAAIVAEKDARISALMEEVRMLAAENSRFISRINSNRNSKVCLMDKLSTDAALREIRAQAVDGFAQDCDDNFGLVEPEDGELYELMAESARAHAASIRSGEQP